MIINNNIKIIHGNWILIRNSFDIYVKDAKIIDAKECGISICESKKFLIENSIISNCDVCVIECFDNSESLVKKNNINNTKNMHFLFLHQVF